ncbi:hypothetical protein [Desulfonema limicola]|nr:hypothetical protein [Desulfonema limicola]
MSADNIKDINDDVKPGEARKKWVEKIYSPKKHETIQKTEAVPAKKPDKEAMKVLRKTRKELIKKASALVKEQKESLKAIKAQLEQGAKTVPEVSEAAGMPADQVLWFMSAMKKYGEIIEAGKDGSFYRYALAGGGSEK